MPGVKRSNPEKWPDSIRRPYKPAVSRGLDQRSSTRRPTVATPRRIWKLRTLDLVVPAQAGTQCLCFALLVLRFAGALLWPLLLRAWSALLFPGPLGDGEAGTRRPRSGQAHGWACLFDRAGGPAEKPGTDSRTFRPWMDGKRRRGVSFSLGYFSLTPGILPSALRAGFAVRTRSCACVDKQRRSNSGAGRRAKPLCRSRYRRSKSSPTLSRRERDSPTSTFPNSSRLASLFKARALRCLEPANWNIEYSGHQCA